ncbi:MAG TPA: hypothetical protein VE338_03080 [Ktedonobacterales bacterium]|jgi:hypothetical protein|nr:hypothetical protein [Ktedonobacterales bacterium]
MKASLTIRLWEAFKLALWRIVRAALIGLVVGFALVEVLALLFNHATGGPTSLAITWPFAINFAPATAFVHVMAVVFALTLAYLGGFTVAVKETFHGLVYAAEHVDDAVASVANEGLNMADAVVDAVDGPNRHGFLGRRGPAEPIQR